MEKVALDANKYAADWEMPSRRTTLSDVTTKVVADCYAAGARFAADGYTGVNNAPVYTGANDNRIGGWIQTYTGRQTYPMDLRADEIDIRDIAHSLASQCRYTGHCIWFYSVAEHSVLMARWFIEQGMAEYALPALLHDATEAYLTDIPRPVKPFLVGYRDAEQRAWLAIAARFGVAADMPAEVHAADAAILVDEREQNMTASAVEWEGMSARGLGVELQNWTPVEAEREFLSTYWNLVEQARP